MFDTVPDFKKNEHRHPCLHVQDFTTGLRSKEFRRKLLPHHVISDLALAGSSEPRPATSDVRFDLSNSFLEDRMWFP